MTATGPVIVEVDSAVARAAIERDLSCYADQWRHLQEVEVEAPYGPVFPEPADIQELSRRGTCIHDVTLRHGMDCIEATWAGNSGRHILEGAAVVISREHPKIDKLRTCTVANRQTGRLELHPGLPDLDIEKDTWRLDVEVNYVQYYRVAHAISSFTSVPPTSSPSTLQVLIGSYYGNSQQRRAINEATGRPPADEKAALASLNDSQRKAVQRSLAQRVLLIQGPPGTGKTHVADVIFRVWKSIGVQGPAVGTAPSNVAADNLARRLLMTKTLDVKRYGPPDKINDDILKISSRKMAIAADWDPSSNSKKAMKRRRQWERKAFAEHTDAVIGTLEMACDLQTEDFPWTSQLILVDEAAQATEPMTIIPIQLADPDSHLVLIGDHMQLAPTVLSKEAEFDGLGTSMFERLMRVGGVDSCMLTLQYRMHESICSWPSREFYGGKLLCDSSVGARDRVKGFPWPLSSALAFVHIKGKEQLSETRSISNRVEARLATVVVKRIVDAASVGTGDIGVITPYDAQTTLIKTMLRGESLGDVEAANIDGVQGREHEVIVLSLARSNSDGLLGHVDDGRRLNVALTRAKRALVVIGDKDTLKCGYESGLSSFLTNVYERGLVIEMPPDLQLAADFLSGDHNKVVMDATQARATAVIMSSRQPNVSRTTKSGKQMLATAAAWIPLAHCDALPSFDANVAALIEHADKLLERMPWLVALAYSLDLPYKKIHTADLPESALEWDMKALSRQHFFTTIGVALDPGNVVLSCVLLVCICRSGACVHGVHEDHMDATCATCNAMPKPKLTEVLRSCGKASKMAQARLLLLCMQIRFSSLRFHLTCDREKAGDVVESTGGILSPWRGSAQVVLHSLVNLFGLSQDDVLETVEAMGALARQCKIFYAHICRSVLNEDARVSRAYATILDRVVPAILPCKGRVCPICESLAALSAEPALATGPTALASLPAAPAAGLAASVMGPTLASSSAAPATGPSALSSATGLASPPPAAKNSAALPLATALPSAPSPARDPEAPASPRPPSATGLSAPSSARRLATPPPAATGRSAASSAIGLVAPPATGHRPPTLAYGGRRWEGEVSTN